MFIDEQGVWHVFLTAEEQLQLNKICELEDKFVKGFSKEKWEENFD